MTDISMPATLGSRAVVTLVVFGAVLWFLGSLFIRHVGPLGAFEGGWRLVVYAATWPLTWPLVPMACRLGGAPRTRALAAVAVPSATALFLDGTAIAWARGLYGSDQAVVLGGAAWLLWAVGVALALGFMAQARAAAT
jgi:uncharacterized membrane protein YqiK